MARADSGLYGAAFTGACRRAGAYFSVTARMDPAVKAAIASIPEDAWTPIRYPRAIWDDQLRAWVSGCRDRRDSAIPAFASKKGQAVTARLIVRRVRDLNPKAAEGLGELFPVWRYHPVFTDSPFGLVQAEDQHRDHAVVEQVFADWTDGPMAHLPSGSFAANAAWLTLAAISGNLVRAAGCLASRGPRQGPRRHHPPRPDRRRRPHRPPRPRPPGPAPARVLAPRGRMAEPVRGGLRPAASPGGLTSPDPVTARPRPTRHPASRHR